MREGNKRVKENDHRIDNSPAAASTAVQRIAIVFASVPVTSRIVSAGTLASLCAATTAVISLWVLRCSSR